MTSDYNFISMTEVVRNFPITQYEYAKMVSGGVLKMIKHRGRHKHTIDSVFRVFHPDNDGVIIKKWEYPYEDINERWGIICGNLKGFPRCYFTFNEEHETGIYRVYDHDRVLKMFVFIEGKRCTMQAYNRNVGWEEFGFIEKELTWI